MIQKLLRRVFTGWSDRTLKPRIIPLSQHGISADHISPCARRTTQALQERGFSAYVVGGAVRDLMLGLEPKDYDIATSATPEEVRATFRRSRIIGRRFRLVHVLCGNETVEVSTYRALGSGADAVDQIADEHGRILRDNVFGTVEEDAIRRDFTVNALYYDPSTEEVLDYCGGAKDLKARSLAMIGDPRQRYREDPVRMLRAVRLAAKLRLTIAPKTRAPIGTMAPLLTNVPSARLFEEMLKLLLSGASVQCVTMLRAEGLHHGLLPMLDVILEQPLGERFVMLALARTDERMREDKPISPGFLFAALLWHEVLAASKIRVERGEHPMPAMHEAMDQVIQVQAEKLSIPKRFGADMKEIWALQVRLENRSGKRPYGVLASPRFRAGYDFLLLRCESGEVPPEIGEWWTQFQDADEATRATMLVPAPSGARRRRRRRGGGTHSASAVPNDA
jgi:poly(A) polymerase